MHWEEALEMFYGFASDSDLGRCGTEDCGKVAGYHELIQLRKQGNAINEEETESLVQFFSLLSCDDPELYACFRTAQLDPNGDVANYINEIKNLLANSENPLTEGCDDLIEYSDRWYNLSTFNAADDSEIKNKLTQLGDEYWIQTLENATKPVLGWPQIPGTKPWWLLSPAVNMDFFGLTITSLPINPDTGDPFTKESFFNYVQLNFATSEFMGEGNPCQGSIPCIKKYWSYLNSDEQTNWTDGNAKTAVFSISMPDDGNVICSEYVSGDNWIFSTLNAPGWFEDCEPSQPHNHNQDGYHPVSGNRQFGILENPDGSFTFYISGVDRLTGFWHAVTAGPGNIGFEQADELWKCFLDTLASFVNENGGTASSDYDCTTVRPDWIELKNLISKGCDEFLPGIQEFPCEQASPCQ